MAYTIDRTFPNSDFHAIVDRVRNALAGEGFGVLTEIDVQATMKKKLDVDTEDYLILGACNPRMAHEAMKLEPRIGAMLPCNVVVRKTGPELVEVSAVDPVASMAAVENGELIRVATDVRHMLEKVVANI